MRPAALIAAVVIAGCGLVPSVPPDWVTNRLPLASCGEETNALNAEARACLLQAFERGSGAEMISTETTIEGDPITRYIRVHENGVVEIFVDASKDRFGSGTWERLRCETLDKVAEANDPNNAGFPEEMVFVENGCEELPVP